MKARRFEQHAEPGHEQCDFCLSPDVQWAFPCRDFTTHDDLGIVALDRNDNLTVSREHIEYHAQGDWAACPACHALIMRGDREKLALRSAKGAFRRHPEIAKLFIFAHYLAHVRDRQDKFWANRCGKPIPKSHPLLRRR